MADPPVSVLVVNYNGAGHLEACLAALERQTLPRHRFEVVVVDNASADGSADLVRRRFPWCRLVPLGRNTGFAEGNNVAARFARGRTLVLLNNDTIPDPHWLDELLRAVERTPAGSAASKLVFARDPRTLNGTGLFLLRDGRGADRGFREPDDGRYEAEEPVFAGCGAAVAVPAPGPGQPILDPRYFVYYEDLDAGWRARLAGRGPVYAPRSLVRHVHGAAAGDGSPVFHFHVERNRALTALRNGDPFLAAFTAAVLAGKVVRAIVRAATGRGSWRTARAVAAGAASYVWHAPRVFVERYEVRRAAGGKAGAGGCGSSSTGWPR